LTTVVGFSLVGWFSRSFVRSLLWIFATFELDNTTQYLELVMLLCSYFVERKRGGEEETCRSSSTNRRLRAFIYNKKRKEYGRKKYSTGAYWLPLFMQLAKRIERLEKR